MQYCIIYSALVTLMLDSRVPLWMFFLYYFQLFCIHTDSMTENTEKKGENVMRPALTHVAHERPSSMGCPHMSTSTSAG